MNNQGYYTANTSNGEWYTPADIIERARWVMHGIDLDPYSSDDAQRTVQASHYFTAQSDGIASPWPTVRSVWVNPPYGKGLIDPCISKVIAAYHAGTFQTGIVLINNATETAWFHALTRICMGGCMFARRIDFVDGSRGGAWPRTRTRADRLRSTSAMSNGALMRRSASWAGAST